MNRKWLFGCFASAGLFLIPAAGLPLSGDTAGAAAPATAASSADSGDSDGAALPAGVTVEWWAQAAGLRESEHSIRDVAAPARAHPDWKAEGNQKDAS